jgi:hypothetical protein
MLVFDISLPNGKLPALNKWLYPKYRGVEDELYTSDETLTFPKNWKKDFPDYIYSFEELEVLKLNLNSVKRRIDPITQNKELREKYDHLVDLVRALDELRGRNGLLVKEYGAEIVTNAWLKMYELMIFLHPLLNKMQKGKGKKKFNSLHVAEAPGNFMLAINHKLKTEYSSVEWDWLANSYRDLYYDHDYRNIHYLPDQYGLIAQYPNRWIFGADGDGDITSPANIISFAQDVKEKFEGNLHFMTSDVKYVPQDVNFDEEERINLPVHLGHLLCALTTLSKGGVMILKEFTFFEAPSISLLYLMSCCFKQLRIVKPETSRPGNSETYVVGTEYKKNLTMLQINRLLSVMNYIRLLNTEAGSPALFRKKDIPADFVEKIIKIETQLTKTQSSHINRNLELFDKYKDVPYQQVRRDLSMIREKAADEWIKKTGIKLLDSRNKIAQIN